MDNVQSNKIQKVMHHRQYLSDVFSILEAVYMRLHP
jgi:hypothetical protein